MSLRNPPRLYSLLVFALCLCPSALRAQEYKMYEYHISDGLPTNVVKDVQQDSLGFFWIATDEGLVRFDGAEYILYKNALHSQYAKRFLKRRNGSLYLIGDLDLIEIVNQGDTATFRTIRQATRNPTDSTLWYPKSIYEDAKERIWIGETQSIASIMGNSFRRYPFEKEDQTPSFTRSFSFFEDTGGDLYAAAYTGRIFRLKNDASGFEYVTRIPSKINEIQAINGVIWIGTSDGLYRAKLLPAKGFSPPEKVSSIPLISGITPLPNGEIAITTFSEDQYVLEPASNSFNKLPFSILDVNRVFVSTNRDIFICGSDGLYLLEENLFNAVHPEGMSPTFIQSIAEDSIQKSVYFATIEYLFKVTKDKDGDQYNPVSVLETRPGQYFLSLVFRDGRLWASNNTEVLLYENDRLVRTWDLGTEGRFVFDLTMDDENNLWASQGGTEYALCLTPELTVKRYPIPLSREAGINVVRQTKKGLYAGSSGENSYLYYKSPNDSAFVNVSIPPTFVTEGDLSVVEIVEAGGVLWLASSEGLLRYDGKSIERIQIGEGYSNQPVKAAVRLSADELLFGTALGLFRYNINSGEWWIYTDGSGLPTNSIYARGILAGSNQTIWVGTSKGIAYSKRSIILNKATPTPWISKLRVNGTDKRVEAAVAIPYGSFVEMKVASNIAPSGAVTLQYKSNLDSAWRTMQGHTISFSELAPGNWRFEFRSKKNGGYDWSSVRSIELHVLKPFWLEYWFQGIVLSILILVSFVSFWLTRSYAQMRRNKLELLFREVTEQRGELQSQAEELRAANESLSILSEDMKAKNEEIQTLNTQLEKKVLEKSRDLLETNDALSKNNADLLQFSYSISHNLRGPVARLMGLTSLLKNEGVDKETAEMLDMVNLSAIELDMVLRDLSDILELKRNVTHMQTNVSFQEEWDRCVSMLQDQMQPDFQLLTSFAEAPNVYCVRGLLHSILYNLLSNALKYRHPERNLIVKAKTWSADRRILFEISDNGLGFDAGRQEANLFKLYKRFHTHVPGRGMGLYLIKAQAEIMNGNISVHSRMGEGTTFTLRLPETDI